MVRRTIFVSLSLIIFTAILTSSHLSSISAQSVSSAEEKKTLRIGYFPNINHAQAVIGLNNGDFQTRLGDNIAVEIFTFNAGPSAIESLLAGRIDVSYIGPNPSINGYVVSGGQDLRIVSGAASGGASFIVRNDSGIDSVGDLGGKTFASPQLGNTQDIALRNYLVDNGYNIVDNGGNVTVVPVTNSDILTLFLKKEIDGAWVPEPWATRLVQEANGKIFVDERDLWPPQGKFVTTNIIVRTDYLRDNPEVIKKLLEAHVDETTWLNNNTDKVIKEFNTQLKKITGQEIPEKVLNNSITKLDFTYDPIQRSLFTVANDAYDMGLLEKGKERPDLSGIYDLTILNQVLTDKGLEPIGDQGLRVDNADNGTINEDVLEDLLL